MFLIRSAAPSFDNLRTLRRRILSNVEVKPRHKWRGEKEPLLSITPEPFDRLRANGEFIEPEQTSSFSPRCVEWVDSSGGINCKVILGVSDSALKVSAKVRKELRRSKCRN